MTTVLDSKFNLRQIIYVLCTVSLVTNGCLGRLAIRIKYAYDHSWMRLTSTSKFPMFKRLTHCRQVQLTVSADSAHSGESEESLFWT